MLAKKSEIMDELVIAEISGTIAFALSGFYVAVKERLDLLQVFIASFLNRSWRRDYKRYNS